MYGQGKKSGFDSFRHNWSHPSDLYGGFSGDLLEAASRVREVEAVWTEEGALLPTDALYHGMHGTCIYVVEQREGRFGIKYVVKEVPVDVVREDTASQKVVLQGIYNPEWIYAAGAEGQLKDGIEVKVMN